MNSIPTREEALELVRQHVHTPNLINHMIATEAFMRSLARRFGEDENKWGIAGLLHDLDWDQTKDDPEKHSLIAYDMLTELGVDPEICNAVKIHNDRHGIVPVTMLDKALQTGETYTGFIIACAMVQPDKKLASVNPQSAAKKFKSNSFAAGANRELMSRSEEQLGIPVDEMIALCLEAMQEVSEEIGM